MNYKFKEIKLSDSFSPISNDFNDLDAIDNVRDSVLKLKDINSLPVEEEIIIERHKEIQNLEQELMDISEIMHTLNVMVSEQSEPINTIEQQIEDSVVNVEEGVVSLEHAEEIQVKTRRTKVATVTGAVAGGVLLGGVGGLAFGIIPGLVGGGIGTAGGAVTGAVTGFVSQ